VFVIKITVAWRECMRVQKLASIVHWKASDMSTVATIEQARMLARNLEHRERGRAGSTEAARVALANRAGVSCSTWRNLALGRLKRLDVWMRDRLQAMLVRELEAEIARLTHDLENARRCGSHLASQHISEIETHLRAARQIMSGDSNH
jgi:hypothetical protein